MMNQPRLSISFCAMLTLLCACSEEKIDTTVGDLFEGEAYEDFSPSFSPDGSKIVFASDRTGNREIFIANADGSMEIQITDDPGTDWQPAWSPDGAKIAFISDRAGSDDIYVMNVDGPGLVSLTSHPARDVNPGWSPDGARILFNSTRDGDWENEPEDNWEIYVMNADGSGQTRLIETPGYDLTTGQAWSPDGSEIVFCSTMDRKYVSGADQFDDFDLFIMDADGSNIRRLTFEPGQDSYPYWSPDGKQISYTRVEKDAPLEPTTGGENYEIYTIKPDGTGITRLTDNPNYDFEGWWSPDSRHMVYSSSREIPMAIYVMDADGGNKKRLTNNH